MASLKLDEGEKKPKDLLDLSCVTIGNDVELKKWLEKIPDLKIRLEKVRDEDLDTSSASEDVPTRSVSQSPSHHQQCPPKNKPTDQQLFLDPIPTVMKEVNLRELGRVDINWRMLTMARPKTKLDEDLFSRLVQLEKLQHRTVQWEQEKETICRRDLRASGSSSHYKLIEGGSRSSSRPQRGVTETRLQTCRECGEEFCSGVCKKFNYEDHARTFNPVSVDIFHIPRPNLNSRPAAAKKSTNELSSKPAEQPPDINQNVKNPPIPTTSPAKKSKSKHSSKNSKVKKSKQKSKKPKQQANATSERPID